jgi:hypothetical protein
LKNIHEILFERPSLICHVGYPAQL